MTTTEIRYHPQHRFEGQLHCKQCGASAVSVERGESLKCVTMTERPTTEHDRLKAEFCVNPPTVEKMPLKMDYAPGAVFGPNLAQPEQLGILSEAQKLTHGDRARDYGTPQANHGRTAALWNAYLDRGSDDPVGLDAVDVCVLNILQKISRYAHRRTRDCLVDIAGYAENASRCAGGVE